MRFLLDLLASMEKRKKSTSSGKQQHKLLILSLYSLKF